MTQMKTNKYLEDMLEKRFVEDMKTPGIWPKVKYEEYQGGKSFSLYDWADVMNLYRKCLHDTLVLKGVSLGLYDKRRSKDFLLGTGEIIKKITIARTPDLKLQQNIRMFGIERPDKERHAKVVELVYQDGIIFDVSTSEENGYFAETGSAYIWEIRRILGDDSIWRPFHLTEEELELKKSIGE